MADPALKVEFEEFMAARVDVAALAVEGTPEYQQARRAVAKAREKIATRLGTDADKPLYELASAEAISTDFVIMAAYRQGMVDAGGLVELLTGRRPAQAGR